VHFFNSIVNNLAIFFSNLNLIQRAFLYFVTAGLGRNSLYRGGEYTLEEGGKCCLLE
jgi:hypothetical protein